MDLKDIVSPDSVICDADVTSKKKALELLAELLARHSEECQPLDIFQLLTEREKLGSTALGHGVALPHARSSSCKKTIGAFIKLDHKIDFDSPDNKPTDLLFALIVPEKYTDEHLRILAGLAGLFSNEEFCLNVRSAKNTKELHNRLTGWHITSQAS